MTTLTKLSDAELRVRVAEATARKASLERRFEQYNETEPVMDGRKYDENYATERAFILADFRDSLAWQQIQTDLLQELARRLEGAERDAARYRWWRSLSMPTFSEIVDEIFQGKGLDSIADTAIAHAGAHKEGQTDE